MNDKLQRTVWSALTTRQNRLARGHGKARRFDPEISPFAATQDNSPDALADLANLFETGDDYVYLMQAETIALPASLYTEKEAQGVMMIQAHQPSRPSRDIDIVPLRAEDRSDMLALADLTKPGPFTHRTPEMGRFWGVRIDGRLAAMTGTRLNMPGYTEISGVCTHPDFQGKGLASALSSFVAERIRDAGDAPLLHAFADNHSAIALYRKLGFEIRKDVNVAVVRRTAGT